MVPVFDQSDFGPISRYQFLTRSIWDHFPGDQFLTISFLLHLVVTSFHHVDINLEQGLSKTRLDTTKLQTQVSQHMVCAGVFPMPRGSPTWQSLRSCRKFADLCMCVSVWMVVGGSKCGENLGHGLEFVDAGGPHDG